jgi:hypothetical protein
VGHLSHPAESILGLAYLLEASVGMVDEATPNADAVSLDFGRTLRASWARRRHDHTTVRHPGAGPRTTIADLQLTQWRSLAVADTVDAQMSAWSMYAAVALWPSGSLVKRLTA